MQRIYVNLFIAVLCVCSCCKAQSELQTIQNSVKQIVLTRAEVATATESQTVEQDLKSMQPDGSWTDQVYTDTDRNHWKAKDHLPRLERIARSFYSRGNVPADVRNRILVSLQYWLDHDPQNVNWWFNEIGVPRNVGNILVMLGDDAPTDLKHRGTELMKRANWSRQTGANLLDETWIQVMRGCLSDSTPVIAEAFARTWQEIRVVHPDQEGIQADGSFHQHGSLLYNESYGTVMLDGALRFLTVADKTSYQPPPAVLDTINTLLIDGDAWMSRGWVWDWGTCGRSICRPGATMHSIQSTLDQVSGCRRSREAEAKQLDADLRESADTVRPAGNRFFWCSDYMVQRQKDFFASIRMYSTRTANTDELTNGENQQSHHIADGATCLMLSGREYFDIYPVWDWRRIPGTTIEQDLPMLPSAIKRLGKTSFAGGVSNQGAGCAAMDLVYGALHAHKSWFCFDDEIVCLGAGIDCDENHPVLTTLNQCLLNGPVFVSGDVNPLPVGQHHLRKASWIWHDSIGYILPQPADVQLKIGPQTGAWSDIGVGSTDRISSDVFNAVIQNGNQPRGATYEYILLPASSAQRTADEAAKPTVQIIANDPQLQAVWNTRLDLLEAAFFKPGEVRAPNFVARADQPCLLMIQKNKDRISLCVSSPSHSELPINVWLSLPVQGDSVSPDAGGSSIHINMPVGDIAGQTGSREFSMRQR